jgi:lipopolysaccharide/colanic/teichoic acid biosynthesis glycosyltransferase
MASVINTRLTKEEVAVSPEELSIEIVSRKAGPYDWIKLLADFSIALILFVLALPVMVIAAMLIRMTSSGPATYSQVRLGRGGRRFLIYKLRTMRHNCEALTGPVWCAKGDPRITPLGRFLRKTHIDELPQLWNILRGDMSLVGPRPERPEIIDELENHLANYRGRLSVKPGLTGLAQIQLPPDTDIRSVREKLNLDLCYVRRYGFWLDIRILVGTVFYLLGVSYAGVRKAMALPSGRFERNLQPVLIERLKQKSCRLELGSSN